MDTKVDATKVNTKPSVKLGVRLETKPSTKPYANYAYCIAKLHRRMQKTPNSTPTCKIVPTWPTK